MSPLPDELGAGVPRPGGQDSRRAAVTFAVVAVAICGFVLLAVLGQPQDSGDTWSSGRAGSSGSSGPVGPVGSGGHPAASQPGGRQPRDGDRAGQAPARRSRTGGLASGALPGPGLSRPQYYVSGTAIALTFDDGPDPRWTPQILALLRANHVHATFCLIGRQARAYPALVRAIVADGNALCDHSWDHDEHLPAGTAAHVAWEIDSAEGAIQTASGGVRPRYYRAPGGNWSPVQFAVAGRGGMRPLAWSVDPRDWSRPGTARVLQAVLAARAGDIVLCHDGGGDRAQTVQALRVALPELRRRGLAFVLP